MSSFLNASFQGDFFQAPYFPKDFWVNCSFSLLQQIKPFLLMMSIARTESHICFTLTENKLFRNWRNLGTCEISHHLTSVIGLKKSDFAQINQISMFSLFSCWSLQITCTEQHFFHTGVVSRHTTLYVTVCTCIVECKYISSKRFSDPKFQYQSTSSSVHFLPERNFLQDSVRCLVFL